MQGNINSINIFGNSLQVIYSYVWIKRIVAFILHIFSQWKAHSKLKHNLAHLQ